MSSHSPVANFGRTSTIRNVGPSVVSFSEHGGIPEARGMTGAVDQTSEFPGPPAVGMPAPPLSAALFGETYASNLSQARVVAFVSSFCDEERDEADLERIRAEVRGLGATLLVLSTKASWCFGPDDRLFKRVSPSTELDRELAAAFESFGVSVSGGRDALYGVFVIDSRGTVAFAHVKAIGMPIPASQPRPSQEVLLRALVIAADTIETAQRGRRPWPDEVTTAGLIAGFRQVTGTAHAGQGRPRRDEPLMPSSTAPWLR